MFVSDIPHLLICGVRKCFMQKKIPIYLEKKKRGRENREYDGLLKLKISHLLTTVAMVIFFTTD